MLHAFNEAAQNLFAIKAGIRQLSTFLAMTGLPTIRFNDPEIHTYPLPWIEVREDAPEGWKDNAVKQNYWRNKNLENKKKMLEMLSKFYADRHVPYDQMLVMNKVGNFEGFILCNAGLAQLKFEPDEALIEKKEQYSKEFSEFYKFLKVEKTAPTNS